MNNFIETIIEVSNNPFNIFNKLFKRTVCSLRSKYYSKKINSGGGKIIITDPFIRFKIKKHKTSHLSIKGHLIITPHVGGKNLSILFMGPKSRLEIKNDFSIGQNVRFFLNENSTLTLGGKDKESGSGITSDTLIMVNKKIEIGTDFICAWNVFISDSDWHTINNTPHQSDIFIGDHVWIANSCSILKGVNINNNSIIASHSKVINKEYPKNSMLAGTPAKIVKTDITWTRDIISHN
nr:hypothetical protein [Gaetbulibacter sp. 4G1]